MTVIVANVYYCVSRTLCKNILATALQGQCYYSHFTDVEECAQEGASGRYSSVVVSKTQGGSRVHLFIQAPSICEHLLCAGHYSRIQTMSKNSPCYHSADSLEGETDINQMSVRL